LFANSLSFLLARSFTGKDSPVAATSLLLEPTLSFDLSHALLLLGYFSPRKATRFPAFSHAKNTLASTCAENGTATAVHSFPNVRRLNLHRRLTLSIFSPWTTSHCNEPKDWIPIALEAPSSTPPKVCDASQAHQARRLG
jgi:hypothetical protein